jgi:hypothetical protein
MRRLILLFGFTAAVALVGCGKEVKNGTPSNTGPFDGKMTKPSDKDMKGAAGNTGKDDSPAGITGGPAGGPPKMPGMPNMTPKKN